MQCEAECDQCAGVINLSSVGQLLITFGPFYKNVTPRGPLPLK